MSGWEIYRHHKGNKHIQELERRKKEAKEQAHLSEFIMADECEEATWLELEGTCRSTLTKSKKWYCEETVR